MSVVQKGSRIRKSKGSGFGDREVLDLGNFTDSRVRHVGPAPSIAPEQWPWPSYRQAQAPSLTEQNQLPPAGSAQGKPCWPRLCTVRQATPVEVTKADRRVQHGPGSGGYCRAGPGSSLPREPKSEAWRRTISFLNSEQRIKMCHMSLYFLKCIFSLSA